MNLEFQKKSLLTDFQTSIVNRHQIGCHAFVDENDPIFQSPNQILNNYAGSLIQIRSISTKPNLTESILP